MLPNVLRHLYVSLLILTHKHLPRHLHSYPSPVVQAPLRGQGSSAPQFPLVHLPHPFLSAQYLLAEGAGYGGGGDSREHGSLLAQQASVHTQCRPGHKGLTLSPGWWLFVYEATEGHSGCHLSIWDILYSSSLSSSLLTLILSILLEFFFLHFFLLHCLYFSSISGVGRSGFTWKAGSGWQANIFRENMPSFPKEIRKTSADSCQV